MALRPRAARRALAVLGVGVAAYFAVQGGEYSLWDILGLRREEARTEERIVAVRAEADSLRAVAAALETQDTAIERVAREQFGMVKEGELLYRFVPAAAPEAPATP